jgi:hypothetical protein
MRLAAKGGMYKLKNRSGAFFMVNTWTMYIIILHGCSFYLKEISLAKQIKPKWSAETRGETTNKNTN